MGLVAKRLVPYTPHLMSSTLPKYCEFCRINQYTGTMEYKILASQFHMAYFLYFFLPKHLDSDTFTVNFTNIIHADNFAFFHFCIALFYSCCQSLLTKERSTYYYWHLSHYSLLCKILSLFFFRICKYWMLCSLHVFHVLCLS